MFINTKKEAQMASQIAANHGFEVLTPDMFYRKYVVNVFAPWSSDDEARRAVRQINASIRTERTIKVASRGKRNISNASSIPMSALRNLDNLDDVLNAIDD